MTAKMLGRHSCLHTLPELHFVEELWSPTGPDGPLTPVAATALADRLLHNARHGYHTPYQRGAFGAEAGEIVAGLHTPLAHAVYSAVLDVEAARHGKQTAVEQTPRNVYFLGDLLDRMPKARVVVVVRDPRDVLLSQRNWWRRRWRGSRVSLPTTARRWASYHPITTTLLWRGGVRQGERWADHPAVSLVRFEDLVHDPQAVLGDLVRSWGLDFESQMLTVPRMSSSNRPDRRGDERAQGPDPTVSGRGVQELGPTELWLCQLLTRRERARHGYDEAVATPAPLALVLLVLSCPVKLALGLLLNRGRTQNLLATVRRRLSSDGDA